MVKDISTKQKNYSKTRVLIIGLNTIGILCLIYFAIPYITHDTTIPNPNAMLAGPRWDLSGFSLVLGVIPLLITNILAYNFIELKNKKIKLLYFIPSLICIILASHYLKTTTINSEPQPKPEKLSTITCKLKNKEYEYEIYNDGGKLSLAANEKDKIDTYELDYTSKENMIKSLSEYYEKQGGNCLQK